MNSSGEPRTAACSPAAPNTLGVASSWLPLYLCLWSREQSSLVLLALWGRGLPCCFCAVWLLRPLPGCLSEFIILDPGGCALALRKMALLAPSGFLSLPSNICKSRGGVSNSAVSGAARVSRGQLLSGPLPLPGGHDLFHRQWISLKRMVRKIFRPAEIGASSAPLTSAG